MLYCDKLKKDKPLYCDNLEKDDMFEDKLFGLQDQLLKAAKDKDMICFIKVWVTMLKTSIQYFIYRLSNSSTFIIVKKLKKKDIICISILSALRHMSLYLHRKNFEVGVSFAGVMGFSLAHIIYRYIR